MTERQRVDNTYEKIRKKYVNITDETEIKKLAINAEQMRTTLISLAFLLGGIICMLLCVLVPVNDYTDSLKGTSFIIFIVCSFEYFRTVLNAEKIKWHYLGEHNIKIQGTLTYDQIIKKGAVKITKATLYDKDDSDSFESSLVGLMYHKYTLYFKTQGDLTTTTFRTKRRFYLKAPMDSEYILALSDSGKVVAAYLSNSWGIDPRLFELCDFDVNKHNALLNNVNNAKETGLKKNNLLLEILICASSIIAYFLPIIYAIVFIAFIASCATYFVVRNKWVLSVINVILGWGNMLMAFLALCIL